MSNQFSCALVLDLGPDKFVATINSPVTITATKGYEVMIEKGLNAEAFANGKIKFAATTQIAIVVVDNRFQQVRVVRPDSAQLLASAMGLKSGYKPEEVEAKLDQVMNTIDPKGELAKLVTAFLKLDNSDLQRWLRNVMACFSGLDMDRVGEEISLLAKTFEDQLPVPTQTE